MKLLCRNRFNESAVMEIADALSLSPATCYSNLKSLEEFTMVRYLEEKNAILWVRILLF